jgi:hypothetical protein
MSDSCVFFWDLSAGDCAAWVQALGTIFAVGVSAMLVWWQMQATDRRQRLREVETILIAGEQCKAILQLACQQLPQQNFAGGMLYSSATHDEDGMRYFGKIIEQVPVHHLATQGVMQLTLGLRMNVQAAEAVFHALADPRRDPLGRDKITEEYWYKLRELHELTEDIVHHLRSEYGVLRRSFRSSIRLPFKGAGSYADRGSRSSRASGRGDSS